MLVPGAIIGGKYRLGEPIGEGGMATIWRAVHTELDRPVAVKLLRIAGQDAADARARFLREARAAASVHHPNVVDIIDYGTHEDGTPYIVMELLEGLCLADRFADGPELTIEELVMIVASTLKGLAAVHDAGIVHRDLKPENIFLLRDTDGSPFPKLLDFGISKVVPGARQALRSSMPTIDGLIFGTPHYMSPEQARGLPDLDRRTDIYSMGVILYEGLTGTMPFDAENPGDILVMIATMDAAPVSFIRPELAGPLSDVVAQAMTRDPKDRFPDALSMREGIIAAADACDIVVRHPSLRPPSGKIISVRPPPPLATGLRAADDTPIVPIPLTQPRAPSEPPIALPPRRSRKGWVLAGVTAVLAAAIAAGVLAREEGAGAEPFLPSTTVDGPETDVPESRTITVRLDGVPDGAEVRVDGAPVATGPIELPRGDRVHLIEVRTRDRGVYRIGHVAAADAVYAVELDPPVVGSAPQVLGEETPTATRTETPVERRRRLRELRMRRRQAAAARESTSSEASPRGVPFDDPGF